MEQMLVALLNAVLEGTQILWWWVWYENLYRLESFNKIYPKQTHYVAITAKKNLW